MTFRTDIQALRGLAVVLVVLHHSGIVSLGAGYLGVDIFFVISGYLITQLIRKDIEQGTFTFANFYFRRAKRLLPAAYVTFLATALLSAFFLDAQELRDFAAQLIGAITFTGNFVLWRQAGYFEGAATLKPLLHVWSLSLEEQYYLLLPAALFFVHRRFWVPCAFLVLIISLGGCLLLAKSKPDAAFYLLPTRAWELAIGSIAALSMSDDRRIRPFASFWVWPAICALVVIPVLPIGSQHPGMDAIVVCVATVIIIICRPNALNSGIVSRLGAKVGDFSYSLYLVHWPIFAFLNNSYMKEPSFVAHGLSVMLAFGLGYLLFRYVELPIRQANVSFSGKIAGATVGASLTLLAIPYGAASISPPSVDYAQVRRPNYGFGTACEFGEGFAPKAECRTATKPHFLVWGDSFAMHLVPGIVASSDDGVIQATKSVCGPLMDIAPFDSSNNTRSWAEKCLAFNRSVFDYLTSNESIGVVVLSSTFSQYLGAPLDSQLWGIDRKFQSLELIDGQLVTHIPQDSRALDVLQRTVERIRSLGKRVVIVAPPPSSGFDIGRCLERKASGRLVLGIHGQCMISIDAYQRHQGPVLAFLRKIRERGVDVVHFDEVLCSKSLCATELDGTFVYRDAGHFSVDGSRKVGTRMGLAAVLKSSAR